MADNSYFKIECCKCGTVYTIPVTAKTCTCPKCGIVAEVDWFRPATDTQKKGNGHGQ